MKKYILILVITTAALVLRLYKVNQIPPSLSWDEVAIGYNAYSILLTGRDEHGRLMPLDTFVSYGDYKPPLPVYLTVPAIALFGLSETGVRFPSVLLGTLTVLVTYFLVTMALREIKKEGNIAQTLRANLPWLSALVLAVSPWHINLSRGGWEANEALFFIVTGVFLCFKAISLPALWTWAFVPFIAAIYTFNSARYFAPILAMVLIYLFRKHIGKNMTRFVPGLALCAILIAPIVPHLLSKDARLRFAEVNIFTDVKIIETANRRIAAQGNTVLSNIIHNRRVYYFRSFLMHYFDHFRPDYLFIRGDGNPKFSTQTTGQMYWSDAPFVVLGLLVLLVYAPNFAILTGLWVLLAISPAAVARETPHALRTLNSLPNWQIWIAAGLLYSYWIMKDYLKNRSVQKLVSVPVVVTGLVYLLQIGFYLHNYYVHYPLDYSGEWQYGYKQALEYIQKHQDKYDRIVMSETIGRPYMYALFHLRFDPGKYQRIRNASFDAAGFYHVYGFDKFIFREKVMPGDPQNSLYILPREDVPGGAKVLENIRQLNGQLRLVIFET